MNLSLRPIREDELPILYAASQDPDFAGTSWTGFRDVSKLAREYEENGFLSDDLGRLAVEADGTAVGFVTYLKGRFGLRGDYYEIGIALLGDFRGRGIGWRAQAMLTDYLFTHMPVQRIQAGTQADNPAEQRALVKAGFRLEGVIRAAEFRGGGWQDGLLYSRLRDDPAPDLER